VLLLFWFPPKLLAESGQRFSNSGSLVQRGPRLLAKAGIARRRVAAPRIVRTVGSNGFSIPIIRPSPEQEFENLFDKRNARAIDTGFMPFCVPLRSNLKESQGSN